jgi:hypothetical protein
MIPIAVTLFYCKLFTSITSIISWITSSIIQIQIWEFEYFLYRLILFIFQLMFPSTLVYPVFIASYQILSRHHIESISCSSKHILSNSYIYSNCNCATWVEYEFISIKYSILVIVMLIQFYYHNSWSYFIMFNEPLSHTLKCHSLIPNHCSFNLIPMYWTIQIANELIEYFNASWIFTHCLSVMYAI